MPIVKKQLLQVLSKLGYPTDKTNVAYPVNPQFGDYSINLAMILAKDQQRDPLQVAGRIIADLQKERYIKKTFEKIEVAKPGFINFYLSDKILLADLSKWPELGFKKVLRRTLKGKKYLLEHSSVNPVHTVHIGHLRNNFIAMCVYRHLHELGADVTLDYINNDRGNNAARAMVGFLMFADKKRAAQDKDYVSRLSGLQLTDEDIRTAAAGFDWRQTIADWSLEQAGWFAPQELKLKSDYFDLCVYSPGAKAAVAYEPINAQIQAILLAWEKQEEKVRQLWRKIIDWSLSGYTETFKRLGSRVDHMWHESQIYELGKKWVQKGLKTGIFKKLKDGAVLSDLSKYNLPDVILLKANGTSLYHTQDIGLTELKMKKFKNRDKYIWCIAKDQTLYLQQLFQMIEQLGMADKNKFMHLSYGYIRLPSGKMSSRLGTVVGADILMDKMKEKALRVMSETKIDAGLTPERQDAAAEEIMLAALKYGLLKFSRERDFEFDMDASLSLQGDSGPYLQYVYARCQSILSKAPDTSDIKESLDSNTRLNPEERRLLVYLGRLPEVVMEAGLNFAPHVLCEFLYKLAKAFNGFYEKHRVIGSGQSEKIRLDIIRATAAAIKYGLDLLGVKVLEKM